MEMNRGKMFDNHGNSWYSDCTAWLWSSWPRDISIPRLADALEHPCLRNPSWTCNCDWYVWDQRRECERSFVNFCIEYTIVNSERKYIDNYTTPLACVKGVVSCQNHWCPWLVFTFTDGVVGKYIEKCTTMLSAFIALRISSIPVVSWIWVMNI